MARHIVVGIAGCFLLLAPAGESTAGEWAVADGTRGWSFPRDHGSHSEYRTEWWYFTGILRAADGCRFGYQLTFFRQGVVPVAPDPGNPWSVRDLYLAHFALTDVREGSFRFAERVSRAGPGLAGAAADGLRVWVLAWSASAEREAITLTARDGSAAPASSATLVGAAGAVRQLASDEVAIETLATWQSPHSGARYPARWRVTVPAAAIDLELSSLVPDQELRTGRSTGVTYWEGAVSGAGSTAGVPIAVEGYSELTGYAGELGGLF